MGGYGVSGLTNQKWRRGGGGEEEGGNEVFLFSPVGVDGMGGGEG